MPAFADDAGDGFQEPAEVHGRGVLAGEFRIEARGVGNIADQPVEAAHVVLDDAGEALLGFVRFRQRQRFDRAPQRGQRVLDLVRDVGGEALDGVDTVIERGGHVAQRLAQMADLVAAMAEVGDLRPRADAAANAVGGVGEAAERRGDGAGEQDRQQRR